MRPVLVATNDAPVSEPQLTLVQAPETHYSQPATSLPSQAEVAASVPVSAEKSSAFMDMIEAITMVLSARMMLLITLIGAFVLATGAMFNPTGMRLAILCAYSLLTILPCVWIETRK